MLEAVLSGLSGLIAGFGHLQWSNLVMMAIGCLLLYLGIKKDFEPLLLVPIGFGAILVNIPLADLMAEHGFLRTIYDIGIITELFPLLIFVGIGAMTDFGPVLENPYTFLLGAAGQCGIFLTLLLALALGFNKLDAVTIGIIGACDGPTVIYVASQYAPHLLGAVSVAAYSYMSLVPIIQPPVMRLLTTPEERRIMNRRQTATLAVAIALAMAGCRGQSSPGDVVEVAAPTLESPDAVAACMPSGITLETKTTDKDGDSATVQEALARLKATVKHRKLYDMGGREIAFYKPTAEGMAILSDKKYKELSRKHTVVLLAP